MNTTNLFEAAEVRLTYKNHPDISERPKITTSQDIANLMQEVEDMKFNIDFKELFYVIYLNQAGKVLSFIKVAEGTTNSAVVDIKHIIQGAILQNASALILCHNHPSQETKPSNQDIELTRNIKNACHFFNLRLVDHIIITSENHFSFTNEGIL